MRLEDNLNTVRLYNFYGSNYILFKKDYKWHHVNGPAWIDSTGCKEYQIDGQFHNPKGPSVIWSNGREFYYLNNRRLSKKEWHEANR